VTNGETDGQAQADSTALRSVEQVKMAKITTKNLNLKMSINADNYYCNLTGIFGDVDMTREVRHDVCKVVCGAHAANELEITTLRFLVIPICRPIVLENRHLDASIQAFTDITYLHRRP